MTLSVAIMTVPQRLHLARALYEFLPGQDTQLFCDDGGLWKNARASWRGTLEDEDATHCMVIQDDIQPVPFFLRSVWEIIEARPKATISLFCSRERDQRQAKEAGAQWLEYDTLCWGQAVIMRRSRVVDFLDWADRCTKPEWKMDDQRIAYYHALIGECIYCPVPSPLQHAKELRSTWANRDGSTLQSSRVGYWTRHGNKAFRPHQRGLKSFLETKSRWLTEPAKL